ncbi:holocarboxylase synthetase [Gossypium australe]|uniref:Holocarboxylase synthetase n=1 Tax=Gossypium australe TaxID=47621 RepID=A0A5B6VWT0_9ROSI|nr:holocarboxylase synthetase [Gossypium australe]
MSKKRKSDATRLDEVDRSMYTTFCSAANSLSQLFSQAMNHQRLSFQAGERHALEKLFQWILRQQEEGSRVTTTDIVSYLQVSSVISCSYCFDESAWPMVVLLLNASTNSMFLHHSGEFNCSVQTIHDCALEVVTITLSLEAIAVEVAPCSLLSNLPKLCQTVIFFPVDFCMYSLADVVTLNWRGSFVIEFLYFLASIGSCHILRRICGTGLNCSKICVREKMNEVEFGAEESPMSPRLSFQPQQHPQTATQLNTSSAPFSSTPISAAKNSVFSNALSSPVRRSLQHYHSVQVGYHSNNILSSANGSRNTETNYCHQQIREVNSPSPNDCMDMHADSPARDFLL